MTKQIKFDQPGEFKAFYAAQDWCRANGISYGSMQRGSPIGLMHGDVWIAKWGNLTKSEQNECHGTMTSPSFRDGPVTIFIKELPV